MDGWKNIALYVSHFVYFSSFFLPIPPFFSQFLSIFVPILTVKIMRIYTGGKGGGGEKKALVGLATIQKLPTNRHAGQMFHNYYMGYQMSDGDHNHHTIGTLALFSTISSLFRPFIAWFYSRYSLPNHHYKGFYRIGGLGGRANRKFD